MLALYVSMMTLGVLLVSALAALYLMRRDHPKLTVRILPSFVPDMRLFRRLLALRG